MRKSTIERRTKETSITVELNLDQSGENAISTGIAFFDHMLDLLAFRAGLTLMVDCRGDLGVDGHHSVEDTGICIGKAIAAALGDKKGIARYGNASVPMDESLAACALDISGRPFLVFNADFPPEYFCGDFEVELTEEFFRALSVNAGITLHINLLYGKNTHHMLEAIFKAVGCALGAATTVSGNGIASTKGIL